MEGAFDITIRRRREARGIGTYLHHTHLQSSAHDRRVGIYQSLLIKYNNVWWAGWRGSITILGRLEISSSIILVYLISL